MPKEAKVVTVKGKRAPRSKKAQKDPNKPKRPMTAFFQFSGEFRDSVKKENPELKVGGIAKILGERWRNLTPEEKQVYQARVEVDKKRYDLEMDAYKNGATNGTTSHAPEPVEPEYDDEEEEEDESE